MATMKSTPSAVYVPPPGGIVETPPPSTFWQKYGTWIVVIVLAFLVYRSL